MIGGLAGIARGSSYNTYDLDVAYSRDRDNLGRLAAALQAIGATLRGAPPDVPFLLDDRTLAAGSNFTFSTRFGPLDILGDPAGAPRYDALAAGASEIDVGGVTVRVAALDDLIAMKNAAGRPKDKLMASEYRTIADELNRRD